LVVIVVVAAGVFILFLLRRRLKFVAPNIKESYRPNIFNPLLLQPSVDMHMIHLHCRFHLPDSSDTLVIAIRTTGKDLFLAGTDLSYITQKLKHLTTAAKFPKICFAYIGTYIKWR
jgi:hypothetical protein